jgi:hypothetical protein
MHIFAFLAIVHYLPFTINCSSSKFDVVVREGEERIVERKEVSCKWFTRDRQLKFEKV